MNATLICSGCYGSSTGELRSTVIKTGGNQWRRLWTRDGDRFYWADDSRTILCEDCLERALDYLGI